MAKNDEEEREEGSDVRESARQWEERAARYYTREGDLISYTISSTEAGGAKVLPMRARA